MSELKIRKKHDKQRKEPEPKRSKKVGGMLVDPNKARKEKPRKKIWVPES